MRSFLEIKEEKMKMKKKTKMDSETSKFKFVGWKNPPRNWESWVRKMCAVHQSTWKNAGIYEAVMSSIYKIKRHDELILEMASRWCSENNTFVFPWGEATPTLEDMLVLGGFSTSGISILTSIENDVELVKIEKALELAMKENKRDITRQTKWMKIFRDCESELEHSAFLSLWLSRFVFPVASCCDINKSVFPIAARLSKGIKIALGPAVLAMLYKDLTDLTKWMCYTRVVDRSTDNVGSYDHCSPFHLVQVWTWERFSSLKPVPNYMYCDDDVPRLARWSKVKISKDRDLGSVIDCLEKAFSWCPYGAFGKRKGMDSESVAMCMKSSELVGIGSCLERYRPERVLRQFGILFDDDQDKILENRERFSRISQVKAENAADSDHPPGFPPKIIVLSAVAKESVDEKKITELLKLPFSETEAFESAEKQQIGPLTCAQINREDYEEFVQLKGSVHETKEDEGEAADTEKDTKCDAESYANGRYKDSGFDLEARISSLESIVYAHIEVLNAAK